MVGRILFYCLALFSAGAWAQSCDTTLNAGAAVGTSISSASAGDVICLNDGNYSGFTLSGVSKSPRVTIRAVNSRGATFTSEVIIRNASVGLTFSGVNFGGQLTIGQSPSADTTRELTFHDFTSNGILVQNITHATPNILFDTFTASNKVYTAMPGSARLWLTYDGTNYRTGTPAITVRHAFMDGNCADGIQAGTALIVEYSIIQNLQVNSCSGDPHVDAVQFYGEGFSGSIVRGNYFYCNVQALVAYDGMAGALIEDNVFDPGSSGCGGSGTIERRPCQIEWLSDDGSTIQRNTVINRDSGTYGFICFGSKPADDAGVNTVIRNNIAYAIDLDAGYGGSATTPSVNTKNLLPGGGGTNITGSPTFAGTCAGALTEGGSWTGCALASGSAGKNAGTDGTDVGTHYFGLRGPTGLGAN